MTGTGWLLLWAVSGEAGFAVLVAGMLRWDRLDFTYALMALMAWVMGPLAFIIAIAEWRKRGDRFR